VSLKHSRTRIIFIDFYKETKNKICTDFREIFKLGRIKSVQKKLNIEIEIIAEILSRKYSGSLRQNSINSCFFIKTKYKISKDFFEIFKFNRQNKIWAEKSWIPNLIICTDEKLYK